MTFAPAALFTLFTWWFSTGVLLYLDHLPKRTFARSLAITTVLSVAAGYGLYTCSHSATVASAYASFLCALMIWAWHELSFLMGWVTGPRKTPCPPDAKGWQRFRYATAIVLHHEIALAVTAAAIVALTWKAPNQVGTATFLVLWVMRLSAKFNVFLGVHNLTTDFVPAHLGYMLSYFRRARINPLMPISVALGAAGVVWLTTRGLSEPVSMFGVAASGLVATTLALAVLEHVFLVLPVPDAALWRWARPHANP